MITIFSETKLNGIKFNVTQDTREWFCIGVGTPPDAGRPYIVGLCFEAPDNRTQIESFPFSKVKFIGNIAG